MADYLEQLVQDVERTVSSGYYDVPLASARGPRLSSVLQGYRTFPIIAEVKIASPSRGRLSHHNPNELIGNYVSGGAAALSVLTEPVRFLGSLETLRGAAGTGLPVLMKDFIVSEEQIDAAASVGAGTVLLIQEVFDIVPRPRRDKLISYAHCLGLEVLLEAASGPSLTDAMRSEADVLGINQRDLRTFEIDRSKGARLLPLALTASLPVVVMSGLEDRRAIEEVRDLGASGALVGGKLSSSDDPGAALRELEVPR